MRDMLANAFDRLRSLGSYCLEPPVASLLGCLAFTIGILLAIGLSVDALRSRVIKPVDSITIRFIDAPTWVGDSLQNHLTSLAAPWLLGTSLQRMDLINAREALIGSGCFSEVQQVRRIGVTTVEIDATFLEPRARVIDKSGSRFIDHAGIVLPRGYRVDTTRHLVDLIEPTYGWPAGSANRWQGEDVASSLLLLNTLTNQPWFTQITAIDLNDFESNRQLVLITDTGSRIVWGSPPGRETALEALSHQKIERLTWLHTHHGRIDQHHRGEIDVTDSSIVTKR